MRKIILYNPHSSTVFTDTVFGRMFRKTHSPGGKYAYMLKETMDYQGDILIYLSSSSFPKPLSYFVPKKLELYLWSKIIGVSFNKIELVNSKNLLKMSEDYVLLGLLIDLNKKDLDILKRSKVFKCFNLTHYQIMNSEKNANLVSFLKPELLMSESNLYKNSSFFRKYFKSYKKEVLSINFVPQSRFINKNPFSKRKNLCVATGTLIELPIENMDKLFFNYFKFNTYQPTRKMIFDNKSLLKGYVDCFIFKYTESKKKKDLFSFFKNQFLRIWSLFFKKTKKEYFSINMVDLYNKYRMFLVPEEVDLPGIGFVEGMACGSVYIGQNKKYYEDMGMLPNKHFIKYDGTINDLKKKIKYYQDHPKELEKIAKEGQKFVRKFCNANYVFKQLLSKINIKN
jgi:hypothetical protein